MVDVLTRELGRYVSAEGEHVLRAERDSDRSSWSVIDALAGDEGSGDARLVEPRVDSLLQAQAIGRDYLPRVHRARRPPHRGSRLDSL